MTPHNSFEDSGKAHLVGLIGIYAHRCVSEALSTFVVNGLNFLLSIIPPFQEN